MELQDQEVRLRTGTCPSCRKEFAFVEGPTVATRLRSTAPEGEPATEGEEEEVEVLEEGPACADCGTPLSFREGRDGALEVSCPECETMTVFVPKGKERPREEAREPSRRFGAEAPRSRPCRKCGAPLRFSTGEDGMLVGECDACGNRFTLPPRGGGPRGGRDFRGGGRYGGRDFGARPRGRPPYSDRGKGRPSRPYGRRDRRRGSDDEEEEREPRRRRPRGE